MIEFVRHPVAGTPAVGEYREGQGGIYAGIMPDYTGTSHEAARGGAPISTG